MPKILEHPATTELFLQGIGETLYRFDGTPVDGHVIEQLVGAPIDEWQVAGEVACLFEWQDPDAEIPSALRCYGLMRITPRSRRNGSMTFYAGGGLLHGLAWARENGCRIVTERVYAGRNEARGKAVSLGGVEW